MIGDGCIEGVEESTGAPLGAVEMIFGTYLLSKVDQAGEAENSDNNEQNEKP